MTTIRRLLLLLTLCALGFAIWIGIPPRTLVIEAGPSAGSYYVDALKYQAWLQAHGVKVTLLSTDDSMEIVRHVDQGQNGVQIGFIAQDVNPDSYPSTRSLAVSGLQPLFIFCRTELGTPASLAALKGRRFVMPAANSATSKAAMRLLARYGITAENSIFAFRPITEAAAALQQGEFDIGLFMLAPANKIIVDLAQSDQLRLLSIREAEALSRLEPYLTPAIIPERIYNIEEGIPPNNVLTLAAKVNVIASTDVHPALIYLLLEAITAVHQGATYVSRPGAYPNLVDISLPLHPLAQSYLKQGVPWIYRNLPLWLSGVLDFYLAIVVFLFAITQLWSAYNNLRKPVVALINTTSHNLLMHTRSKLLKGRPLTRLDWQLFQIASQTLNPPDRRRIAQAIIEEIHTSVPQAGRIPHG